MRTIIIAEKPKVSLRIAKSLSQNYSVKREKGIPYYVMEVDGNEIVVASVAGHLYSIRQQNSKWGYPIFEVKWEPTYKADKSKLYLKKYIDALEKLSKDAERFYIATDYDMEGELLGYNALRFACKPKTDKVSRMKFSTLTQKDLERAFKKPIQVDLRLVDAAEVRHVMDWFWGINTSRALSMAGKKIDKYFSAISAGRVQTPALAIIASKEKEIKNFKPISYWEVFANLDCKGVKIKASHTSGRIFDENQAEKILENSKSDKAILIGVKKEKKQITLFPFDLTSLQVEAYKLFGYLPRRVQEIAQALYEGGYISYPRTSSQKLPYAIGYKTILKNLRERRDFGLLIKNVLKKEKIRPMQGTKTDPAHPAIYPTGILPEKLNVYEEKIYKLIVLRFIACFYDPLVVEDLRGECKIGKEKFVFGASKTVDKGWTRAYPYAKRKEIALPELAEGDLLKVEGVEKSKKETKPPSRYNPASLVKELENRGLGTKATRAEIVETLYKRGYIKGKAIGVTEFGLAVISALEENVPDIISEELTRKFEKSLENIKMGEETKKSVLEEAKKELSKIFGEFKKKEIQIGEKLVKGLQEKEKIGECPACKGDLKIIKSRKTNKIFIGCSRYPDCSVSYPLPQKSGIGKTDKKCHKCGLPMVSIPVGRRRMLRCIDMSCKAK